MMALEIILAVFFCGLLISALILLPAFGRRPSGDRLKKIRQSPHYSKGAFRNLHATPVMAEDTNFFRIMKDFRKSARRQPKDKIPSVRNDLVNLNHSEDWLVWFGHSSYFMLLDGKTFLVDPVFSGAAGPLPFFTRAFRGADVYKPEDIPEIDYLIITHDHWDHLDHKTLRKLRSKIKTVVCSLGTGAHLEFWGFSDTKIHEEDWGKKIDLEDGFTVHTTPARHFSGRGLIRNKTQWASYVLLTPGYRIFIGGDSGYDTHFAEIGKTFGGFDLAILENGQYNKNWKYIHSFPEQTLQATRDLNARRLFPVHSSKFTLSLHPWKEPLEKIVQLNEKYNIPLLTPVIGEAVNLKSRNEGFRHWWESVD